MPKDFDDFDPEDSEALEAELDGSELTPEQFDKLREELHNFQHSFLSHLAGTAKYEIIPTEIDVGEFLDDEHYNSVKKECLKAGVKVLYTYNLGKMTIILNPSNLRTVVVQEEGEAH